jgi:dienelactone hydrolase
MVSTLLVALAVVATDPDPFSMPGPQAWGERAVGVSRPDNTTVTARVYYPATLQGLNRPIDPSGGTYPIVTFAPGFSTAPTAYASTMRHLATHGYLVIVTSSQSATFEPDRLQYVADVRGTIDYLIAENARAASPFFGRVDTTKVGASGHSLGGGISIVAAAEDPRILASATLAAASLRDAGPLGPAPPPYADVEVTKLQIPVSLINGSLDGLIPVSTNGQVLYDAAHGPRLLPNLIGGYHGGFWDPPVSFDEGTVTQAENLAFARAELLSFFDLYLKGDQDAWRRQWGPERLAAAGVIDTQLDPGFSIAADDSSKPADVAGLATYDLLVQNTGDRADSFKLFVEDNHWGLSFSTLQTPLLAPGETFSLQAFVTVPATPGSTSDQALVSARSDADGGTRAWTYLTTAVVPEPSALASATVGIAALLCMAFNQRRKVMARTH